jgi:hypothetical protein
MFCTVCHVAFNYRTGEIAQGPVHNPHYFELLGRLQGRAPREPGDIPCGGFPSLFFRPIEESQRRSLENHMRICTHISAEELPRLNPSIDPNVKTRVRFILNDIDESRMASLVTKKDTDEKIKQQFAGIFRAFVDASQDVYARFAEEVPNVRTGKKNKYGQEVRTVPSKDTPAQDCKKYIDELHVITHFTNEASEKIGKKYRRTYFQIPLEYGMDVTWV